MSGSELCQLLRLVIKEVNEDCADCKKKRIEGEKGKAGGNA